MCSNVPCPLAFLPARSDIREGGKYELAQTLDNLWNQTTDPDAQVEQVALSGSGDVLAVAIGNAGPAGNISDMKVRRHTHEV